MPAREDSNKNLPGELSDRQSNSEFNTFIVRKIACTDYASMCLGNKAYDIQTQTKVLTTTLAFTMGHQRIKQLLMQNIR